MSTTFVIASAVIGGLIGLWVILWSVFFMVRKRLAAAIDARFSQLDIIVATTRANFFGQESKGGRQIRGNGALVLTRDHVYFLRAVPEKEYTILLTDITQITLPKMFNGKSIITPLLCLHFNRAEGRDAIAWAVKKPHVWKAAIEDTMEKYKTACINGHDVGKYKSV